MQNEYIIVEKSPPLCGEVALYGAKNAVLVIMASLLLTSGKSILRNVPRSADVLDMIKLLTDLGAKIEFDEEQHVLKIDTSKVVCYEVLPDVMAKMRASILVMGPLLARFGITKVALPGGCSLGARPIDMHLKGFKKMGVTIKEDESFLEAQAISSNNQSRRIILEYPSVGATENLIMFAAGFPGETTIVNAALEPEVLDFIEVLKKMGAHIFFESAATVRICGVTCLRPVVHDVVPDRLEAGALLLAAALTKGDINLPTMRAYDMDCFLEKLSDMGHVIHNGDNGRGVRFIAHSSTRSVHFKTGPHPCFPTDLQAPMMVAQCVAQGTSVVEETVFENRMMHVDQLQKMGADISLDKNVATVRGVKSLRGCDVQARDIRGSCALVLAGLIAEGTTRISGISHWRRGYDSLEKKLQSLGACISIVGDEDYIPSKTSLRSTKSIEK